MHKQQTTHFMLATILTTIGIAIALTSIASWTQPDQKITTPAIVKELEKNPVPTITNLKSTFLNDTITEIPDKITDEQAKLALEKSKQIYEQLQQQNFGYLYSRDLYLESKKAYEGENITKLLQEINQTQNKTQKNNLYKLYSNAKKILNGSQKLGENYTKVFENLILIQKRQKQTYELSDAISLLQETINSLDRITINFSEADAQYIQIKQKFQNEQFDSLNETISDAYTKIDQTIIESTRLRTIYKSSKRTLANFLKTNYRAILFNTLLLTIAGLIFNNEYLIKKYAQKINEGIEEKKILTMLIKKAQDEYFIQTKISRRIYDAKIKKYREKITRLTAEIPVLQKKIEQKNKHRQYYMLIKQKK